MFLIGLLLFIVCMIVQFFALHRTAFGRSLFITAAMFLVGFMVSLSPYTVSQFISKFFYILGWGFMLLVTWQSIVRRMRMKKLTDRKS
ncbi:hypothetical protein [Effusibacillus dendaii]|uniref:Uncharacterized protein n=1 Tax=Effusibacillus dendaii TaxID=2743772 RepID=A0A7I8DF19_9BACL|nr:hypothetical protein [Effusibacillus dendaii]BCJ87456.1 hypothetical protein skT53_24410 [Effusibacillus dendaii]